MKAVGNTVAEILENAPEDKKVAFTKLHQTILDNLPEGFETGLSYGGLGYVVPHSLYPAGYHCKPEEPLPFVGIAIQKHSINLYHMGIYAFPEVREWFVSEYSKYSKKKLDMGKSCIRFKKPEDIPYELIAQLMRKITVDEWIAKYELSYKK